jgi:CheY-like chemotaxis protein
MRNNGGVVVLVVIDVEEVRDGLQLLLESDGYRVETARSEKQAVECAFRTSPQLVIINITEPAEEVIAASGRIRANARMNDHVPIVLFCVDGLGGSEVSLGGSLYSSEPDNFNDFRKLLQQLLLLR